MHACTTCRNLDGLGRNNDCVPRIVGKSTNYLFRPLIDFPEDCRSYPLTRDLLAYPADSYLHKIAAYFAALRSSYPNPDTQPFPAPLFNYGKKLVTQSDPSRELPACAACQGAEITGTQARYPALDRLVFERCRGTDEHLSLGHQRPLAPDCMHTIDVKPTDRDIIAAPNCLQGNDARAEEYLSDTDGMRESTVINQTPFPVRLIRRVISRVATRSIAIRSILRVAVLTFTYAVALTSLVSAVHAAEAAALVASGTPDTRPEIVIHGEYLARAGDCVACHTAPRSKTFGGGLAMDTPFGTLYSPNISPDVQYGIGTWSADAFFKMMRTGKAPDGRLIYPVMPIAQYTKVTREDSDASSRT
jgi:cytochrome c553